MEKNWLIVEPCADVIVSVAPRRAILVGGAAWKFFNFAYLLQQFFSKELLLSRYACHRNQSWEVGGSRPLKILGRGVVGVARGQGGVIKYYYILSCTVCSKVVTFEE